MPAGLPAGHHRAPAGGGAAGPHRLPRPSDQPAQLGDVPAPAQGGGRAGRAERAWGRRAARRPGRLQARERQLRARLRRRAGARGIAAAAGDPRIGGHGLAARRRRVCDPAHRPRPGRGQRRHGPRRRRGGRAAARGPARAGGAVRHRDLLLGERRHQPLPGGRGRSDEPPEARRHRAPSGQGGGPRRPAALHPHIAGRARAAVDGGAPAARDRRAAAAAPLPAARRPAQRRDRGDGGAGAVAGRRHAGDAGRLHSPGRADGADRADVRLGRSRRRAGRRGSGATRASTCTCRSTCRRPCGSRWRCAGCCGRSSRSASSPTG